MAQKAFVDKVFFDAWLLSPLVPVESLSLFLGFFSPTESFSSFASLFSRTFHGFFTGWICEINAKGLGKAPRDVSV